MWVPALQAGISFLFDSTVNIYIVFKMTMGKVSITYPKVLSGASESNHHESRRYSHLTSSFTLWKISSMSERMGNIHTLRPSAEKYRAKVKKTNDFYEIIIISS